MNQAPLRIEQAIRSVSEIKAAAPNAAPQTKRRRGRPKGSKNKDKTQVNLLSELRQICEMLSTLLSTMGESIPLEYLLLDGKFGHNNAVQMTRHLSLYLVSKLRYDSVL